MIRRMSVAALALAMLLPLGGCAVSLFSHDLGDGGVDEDKLQQLERRMDAIEKALPPS